MFLILYVDDILLIGNDVGSLSTVKIWLENYFKIKDLGEANYILGIKVLWDRQNKILGLSQVAYILVKFAMHKSKKGLLLYKHGVPLSNDQC